MVQPVATVAAPTSAGSASNGTALTRSASADGKATASTRALSSAEFSAVVVAVTSAFGDPTRREVYLYVRDSAAGVTASQVAQHFSLHPNVARHHLDKLAAGGYLEVFCARSGTAGAGRPSKHYRGGPAPVLDVPKRGEDLLIALLGAALALLPRSVAEDMAEQVGFAYGCKLAGTMAAGDGQRSFRSALRAVADALTAHGFAAHAEARGRSLAVVKQACPFFDAALQHPVVCAIDRGMVKGMVSILYGHIAGPTESSSRAMGDQTCMTCLPAGVANRQDRSVRQPEDTSITDITGPLEPGVRVSLELPEAGTCVAVVASKTRAAVALDLLDEVPSGELEPGSTLDLFMPRPEGIYHWLCVLSAPPTDRRAVVELLSSPVFVQRRLGQRLEAGLQAQVRRVHSARRGKSHAMQVADLSRGGMKLEGPVQLSTGDTLEITVDLGVPVQITGRAVMTYRMSPDTWAAHVSFLDDQRDVTDVLDAYIARHFRRLSN
jgi:predicted ArsR family transcriptional regulator